MTRNEQMFAGRPSSKQNLILSLQTSISMIHYYGQKKTVHEFDYLIVRIEHMIFNDVRTQTIVVVELIYFLSLVNRTHLYDCEIGSILIILYMLTYSMAAS